MQFRNQLGQISNNTVQAYPWEIDLLTREIILNARIAGKRSLGTWQEFSTVINRLRDLENEISERYGSADTVLREVHRIVHQQFPWQRKPSTQSMMRAYKIFGTPELRKILEETTGIALDAYFQLGLACSGHFLREPGINTEQDYAILGASREVTQNFFEQFTIPLKRLKEKTIAEQRYDDSWLYAFNPLRGWPFIQFDLGHPERVLCPIPTFLMRRFSEGIFYDVVGHANFANAFGKAFEQYVGVVLERILDSSFTICSEQEYWVGNNRKDGVDWIVSDQTGHLFIECKTRRLRQDAKFIVDNGGLEAALDSMAKSIVQHYRNINEALDEKTKWKSDGLPIYPLIVTLENWYIFSPPVIEILKKRVHTHLDTYNIDRAIIDKMPYVVASADEFETAIRISSKTGLAAFFGRKHTKDHRDFAIPAFSLGQFRKELEEGYKPLFAEEFKQLGLPKPQ